MDPELINFLSAFVLTGAISLVTQLIKCIKGVEGFKIQLVVFAIAIVISVFQFGWQFVPVQYAEMITTILGGAMLWYEVVFKHFQKEK